MATRTISSSGDGFQGHVDAVFVGVATLDAIALVDGFPAPDERVIASEVVYAGGGPAATAAVTAARLGIRTAFVGTVGDDDNGRAILAGLEVEGVDVHGVTVSPGQASAASVVVVDRVRDSRAICNRPAPRIDITAGLDLIASAPVVHVDHAGWAPVAATGLVGEDQLLSVDAGNPIPGFTPRGVGLFVPTVEALRRTYDATRSVGDLLAHAVADGCSVVVATDGARGSSALTATGESAHAPAHTVPIHSTLGAGDVFHGALVAAVVKGLRLDQQLAFANVTAALSCRGLDGRSQIPSLAEVETAMPAIAH
jgi:sugar/nucleoside kinase (ribokinase family)